MFVDKLKVLFYKHPQIDDYGDIETYDGVLELMSPP